MIPGSRSRASAVAHGINWWIALHQPEYEGREEAALVELYRRTTHEYEGMMMQRSTPPGGDLQSWLYPKSTMLGQGVPLFLYIHSYEAGGPGIVSPVSGVMSHLSWPLPVYLNDLQTFLKPGNGMTGGASLVAGMEVAWWHPDLDPHHYMRNWNLAKFGPVAGEAAYQAMVDTHKITESFLLETKQDASEGFTLYRWRAENFLQPYEGDMTTLKTVALDGVTNATQLALYDFMVPQARQPQALQSVRPDQRASWQKKFEIEEAIAIAERAEIQMRKALAEKPFSPDIQRLHQAAAVSKSLTQLFRHFHLALLDAKLARFRLDVERLYVGTSLCVVREAAHLFDREFGGENLTSFYDEVIAAKTGQAPSSTTR